MQRLIGKWIRMVTAILILGLMVSGPVAAKRPGGTGEVETGNCLSFPVIWAEDVEKTLRGEPEMTPVLEGTWWYQWGTNGTDPNITPAACPPDPDENDPVLNPDRSPLCDDGKEGEVDLSLIAGIPQADNDLELSKAYLQKDPNNIWQADSVNGSGPIYVDWIDWGDNLESVDWYTRSQVRTEVVLFQELSEPMKEYQMRHTSGWGIDEVHGLAASIENNEEMPAPGTRATVYSPCARLTIQKLLVERSDLRLADLEWDAENGYWKEPGEDPNYPETPYPYNLVNPPIFNKAVHEAGDGPGYYNAEINVKGRIIYGYTWNVRTLHDMTGDPPSPAGDYRLTFSFDRKCGTVPLNTFFMDGTTEIMVPLEEEIIAALAAAESEDSGDSGGGVGVLIPAEFDDEPGEQTGGNLTYIDVRILERSAGSGGGSGGQGGNGRP